MQAGDRIRDSGGGFAEVHVMFQILVVEDDKDLNRTVCSFLNGNGYRAVGCPGAKEAYEFAKTVRSLDAEIPILFMTARDDFASKQKGYRIGIDDYMVKPIDLDELLLRIGALLRRARIAASHKLEIGKLRLDMDQRTAEYDGEEIPLTAREFNILYKLLSYPGKTFTRTQLMDEFWDAETNTAPRAVDVYMTKLRGKFGKCTEFELKTVHGLGYKAVIL